MVSCISRCVEKMMNGHGQGIRKIVVKVEFVKNVTTNVNLLITYVVRTTKCRLNNEM